LFQKVPAYQGQKGFNCFKQFLDIELHIGVRLFLNWNLRIIEK
jgi:hypothetical protein